MQFPFWLTSPFLQRLLEKFVHHADEYIESNLIDVFSILVKYDYLSPFDSYVSRNFTQLTQYSLDDIVCCALIRSWFIILRKSNEHQIDHYHFACGSTITSKKLLTTVITQIPLSIGLKDQLLDNVIDFLFHDDYSDEIKMKARQLICHLSVDQSINKTSIEILDEEFRSILHWLEHPDEYLILDCD
ncbi:unnamed protein product [Rotaria sordida]|uniref:Uncharacterized protein n=1 Tax=Rotaria sordida TaxID=392033 RepID=A0A819FDU5_9BILA|nr:unnamed protein product [Rotaria sordida]CAF0917535.1 unnamed protein product [Rotaria sordida]CAF0975527.1 unnamed protein product [Rotaria sordida]CAF1068458.1 unnamed protein product [Rotaria sordida]CAF1249144.1 unnamed protein product [Rotaria sordida]